MLERCRASKVINKPIKNITIKVDRVPTDPIMIIKFSPWVDSIPGGNCLPIKYELKMQNGNDLL